MGGGKTIFGRRWTPMNADKHSLLLSAFIGVHRRPIPFGTLGTQLLTKSPPARLSPTEVYEDAAKLCFLGDHSRCRSDHAVGTIAGHVHSAAKPARDEEPASGARRYHHPLSPTASRRAQNLGRARPFRACLP